MRVEKQNARLLHSSENVDGVPEWREKGRLPGKIYKADDEKHTIDKHQDLRVAFSRIWAQFVFLFKVCARPAVVWWKEQLAFME
ncbi:hypothetical protein NPIL_703961 [Nephila pilipes]|uniref:Uncharacterized protein n=1 Tax=Nephila pilipes TaxID=299642 RepID=A0A8X6J3T0_NEPPI|nr:hypothetical protein NPIL_703961 [Nephila pilipes]